MSDAPQHGTTYTSGGDDYPHGDPDGITSDVIFTEFIKKGIDLIFLKITNYTDQMIEAMKRESSKYQYEILDYDCPMY